MGGRRAFLARIEIPLDREGIFLGDSRVRAEAGVKKMPAVLSAGFVQRGQGSVVVTPALFGGIVKMVLD